MAEGLGRHLSYESIKQIVKFSEMDQRERMVRSIPVIKRIESQFPYDFEEITCGPMISNSNTFEFKTNKLNRAWMIQPLHPEQRGRSFRANRADPELPGCIVYFRTKDYRFEHLIEKKKSVALTELVKEYLRKGSRIEKLVIDDAIPEELENENLKLKVNRLVLEYFAKIPKKKMVRSWLRLIDTDNHPLKTIKLELYSKLKFMLKEPAVQSCEELILEFPYDEDFQFYPLLLETTNKHLDIVDINFPADIIEKLIQKWLNYRRPVGTSFCLGVPQYTEVIGFFDMAKETFKAVPSKFPDIKDATCHCVVIPIDEQMELVVFGEYREKKWPPFVWNFRMEVMKPGKTVRKKV